MARAVVACRVNLALSSAFASSWWFELFGGFSNSGHAARAICSEFTIIELLGKAFGWKWFARAMEMGFIDVYASFKLVRT
jgi:hypothetical protein